MKAIEGKTHPYEIHPIPVLQDNIIWIWVIGKEAVVVDPAITDPVIEWLKNRNFELIAILQTHHHEDHIGGTQGLISLWPNASVIASKEDLKRIPFQTISVNDGDEFNLMGIPIKVLKVPGHTSAHLAFYLPKIKPISDKPALFCGDTLFGGGCGRLFEGSSLDMFKSLDIISQLPPETQLYCAHEYTEDNLKWAASLRPKDLLIKKRLLEVSKIREEGKLTIPSTIKEERSTNLFIRANSVEEFASLRSNKDQW